MNYTNPSTIAQLPARRNPMRKPRKYIEDDLNKDELHDFEKALDDSESRAKAPRVGRFLPRTPPIAQNDWEAYETEEKMENSVAVMAESWESIFPDDRDEEATNEWSDEAPAPETNSLPSLPVSTRSIVGEPALLAPAPSAPAAPAHHEPATPSPIDKGDAASNVPVTANTDRVESEAFQKQNELFRAELLREETMRREHAEAMAATRAATQAVWNALFKPAFSDINAANLVVPFSTTVQGWINSLKKNRQSLAAQALVAVYFNICFTGKLEGTIAAKLMAAWVWGVDSEPAHWRTQLITILPKVVAICAHPENGNDRLQLIFDTVKNMVTYRASPSFLGQLHSMVSDGNLKFIRSYQTFAQPTDAQFQQLKHLLGYDEYFRAKGAPSAANCVREEINEQRDKLAKTATLSTLAKRKLLGMQFMPSLLGAADARRKYGLISQVLAQNHTRRSTISNRKIADFNGRGKLVCKQLSEGVTYDVFAGNGTWKNTGYFASAWAKHHGLKDEQTARLFTMWATAAAPLGLVIVGVDKKNNQFDLAAMTQMVKSARGKLWELKIRIYSPDDWQQRWTRVFQMPLPTRTDDYDGSQPKAPLDPPGDLAEIAELVRQAGSIRKTAGALKIDYSDLAKYLKTGRGLSAVKAAALRQHLCQSRPAGGLDIAGDFAAITDQYPGNLGYALAYRRLLGWSVVPIQPGTRAGYFKFKQYQSILPSEAQIIEWWTAHPDASIGLILGALSGVFAFDIDNPAAESQLFQLIGEDPQCPIQRSGSWAKNAPYRKHYLYQYPANIRAGAKWEPLVEGLEFRGSHGLLIMAPSRHKTWTLERQKTYSWTEQGKEIWSIPMTPLPQNVLDLLIAHGEGKSPSQLKGNEANVRRTDSSTGTAVRFNGMKFSVPTQEVIRGEVKKGKRNPRLFNACQELRDRGLTQAEATNLLLPGAQRGGLAPSEILRTIASVNEQKTRPRKAR